MHVEQAYETRRANDEAARLEPSTAAVRALNDAMASVCEGLLQRGLPAASRAELEQQQIQAPDGRQD